MSQLPQPVWMTGFSPAPRVGNPAWKKGGPSPNPSGRPKGIVDKRTKVTQVLAEDAPAIARVVIDAALEGDMQAASLVLSRVAPALRSEARAVTFDFDPTAPVSVQVEAVLAALASGAVAVDGHLGDRPRYADRAEAVAQTIRPAALDPDPKRLEQLIHGAAAWLWHSGAATGS